MISIESCQSSASARSIFGKLGVRDRAAAIVFAYDHGVVTPRCDAAPRIRMSC
jgi:hypothetical protein